MSPKQLDEEAIFDLARMIETAEARSAYLEQACGDNTALLERVKSLLEVHDQQAEFLESPSSGVDATLELPLTERPGTVIGKYKLMEQIGEGGMGVVYVAEQERPMRRRVALKVIKPGMDSKEVVSRFAAERQALALMDHPNIAKVHDAGTTESGRPYFVMELVRGLPITEYCDLNKFNARQRLDLFIHVCQAVQHAHQKGIIHRDLKPSNVLITEHDGTPVAKVIDFGVAKAINQQLTERTIYTRHQQMVGTPMYMSPEQAELSGLDVDTRTDVYSLGVLLYELLTGTTPFDKQRFSDAAYDEIRRIIREEEPPKPSTRISTLGAESGTLSGLRKTDVKKLSQLMRGELDWIVLKALDKERGRRYETANAFADDVRRFLDDEPVAACPPSASYRVWKLVRRHKAVIATASVVAVSIVIGLIGTASQAVIATGALHDAEVAHDTAIEEKKKADDQRLIAEQKSRLAEQHQRDAQDAQKETRRNLYLMEMNFAGQAIFQPGGVAIVLELLDRWQPRTDDEDLRGWEWFCLNTLCHQYLYSLSVPNEQPDSPMAVWSPDGKWIASRGSDSAIWVWEVAARRVAFALPGNADGLHRLVWSPDGGRLVSTHTDGFVRVWSMDSQHLEREMQTETGRVSAIAWSPDGTKLAMVTSTRIRIWDLATENVTLPFPNADKFVDEQNWPGCLAWHPEGQEIAVGYWNGSIRLWDLDSGESTTPLAGHDFPLNDIRYSPDGTSLASTSADGTVRIWNLGTGGEQELPGHRGFGLTVAWSPDGDWLASGGGDKAVRVWSATTGDESLMLSGHTASVNSVSWSPDSSQIVTSGDDGAIKVWDALRQRQPATLSGHSRWVFCVAWSPDGMRLASSSGTMGSSGDDARVRIWEFSSGQVLPGKSLSGDEEQVRYLCWHPDGIRVTSVSHDGRVNIWNTVTGLSEDLPTGYDNRRDSVAWSLDGKRLAAARLKYADVWEEQFDRHFTVGGNDTDTVWSVAWNPAGTILATAHHDGTIRLWDMANHEEPSASLQGHVNSVRSIAWSPDGTRLASAGMDSDVRIWDVSDRSSKVLSQHASPVYSVCWSPDGTRLASGSFDHTVKIWDTVTGALATSIEAHRNWVMCVSWSPDGKRIASASRDHTIRVWDAPGYELD